eukprot:2703313-Amphidinium_carterae.1
MATMSLARQCLKRLRLQWCSPSKGSFDIIYRPTSDSSKSSCEAILRLCICFSCRTTITAVVASHSVGKEDRLPQEACRGELACKRIRACGLPSYFTPTNQAT